LHVTDYRLKTKLKKIFYGIEESKTSELRHLHARRGLKKKKMKREC